MKANIWLKKVIQSLPWTWILVALPWVIGSSYLWNFSSGIYALPLHADPFEVSFKVLFNHRIVLNSNLLHPLLVIVSFLPLILLLVLATAFFYVLPRDRRLSFSLAFISFFYLMGAPGTDPLPLAKAVFSIVLLVPLFRMPSPLFLWGLGTLAVIVSLFENSFQFPVFWMTFSLALGYILNFLIAERALASHRVRSQALRSLLQSLAVLVFTFWIFASLLTLSMDWNFLHPSPSWWLAWVIVAQCVLLTWYRPWESARWLCIGIFGQGICLSQTIQPLIYILMVGLSAEILFLPHVIRFGQRFPSVLIRAFQPTIIVCALFMMFWNVFHFKPNRTFGNVWISVLKEIDHSDAQGFLVVGEGLPFLANFIPGQIVKDDTALLKTTERDLGTLMDEYKVTDIIIDKTYLNNFWKSWIASGKPADIANYSVISRAITYKGESINTPTMKFPALRELTPNALKGDADFVWLKRRQKT